MTAREWAARIRAPELMFPDEQRELADWLDRLGDVDPDQLEEAEHDKKPETR